MTCGQGYYRTKYLRHSKTLPFLHITSLLLLGVMTLSHSNLRVH